MHLLNVIKYGTILSITINQHVNNQVVLQISWRVVCVDV